jgi:L-seryl-tRNA(Ser) seleniumtransferase
VASASKSDLLRQIPSVDELLRQPRLAALAARIDRELLVEITRAALIDLRARLSAEADAAAADAHGRRTIILPLDAAALQNEIANAVEQILSSSLQPVINATGVILHTNLGRAPLTEAAVEEFRRTATQYSNLEYDLEAGARGKRDVHTAHLIEHLTGAEAAIVVNNCAAAVLLVLAALARDGEVLVSRGELIEIGDGFRIPEIMAQSGATLREVGTTNRTHLKDYENAITDKTRVLLRVHPSNFQITGFTDKPSLADLAALAARKNLPLVEDLGSGCIVDLSAHGIVEPLVRQSIEAGADIVMFSGDKLLGGPQAGIIAGKKDLVAKIRRHPLFRALRVDKLTIAAIAATLGAFLRAAYDEIPALRMIRLTAADIQLRAENLVSQLTAEIGAGKSEVEFELIDGDSLVGGGSTPAQSLPTKLIRITSARHSAAQLEQRLRRPLAGTSVIARVESDRLILDLRTVLPAQEPQLVQSIAAAFR